jgi:SAM-dependent methyltransferase
VTDRDSRAPTERFSSRADDYAKYRPGYPEACFDYLRNEGISEASHAVDVGSGTGIFSQGLLQIAGTVSAVEPNEAMRAHAESRLAAYPGFRSVPGSAEDTGLEAGIADLVTVAQAFHWFDRESALDEFRRILTDDGLLALVWNRRDDELPFLAAYDALLKEHAPEYGRVNHRNLAKEDVAACFDQCELVCFSNVQYLDRAGLLGRAASSSYAPGPTDPGHDDFFAALKGLFDAHAESGRVEFSYQTMMFVGHIAKGQGGEES